MGKPKEIDHEVEIDKIRNYLEKKGLDIQDMYFLLKRATEGLLDEIIGDEEEPEEELDDEETEEEDGIEPMPELPEEPETEEKKKKKK